MFAPELREPNVMVWDCNRSGSVARCRAAGQHKQPWRCPSKPQLQTILSMLPPLHPPSLPTQLQTAVRAPVTTPPPHPTHLVLLPLRQVLNLFPELHQRRPLHVAHHHQPLCHQPWHTLRHQHPPPPARQVLSNGIHNTSLPAVAGTIGQLVGVAFHRQHWVHGADTLQPAGTELCRIASAPLLHPRMGCTVLTPAHTTAMCVHACCDAHPQAIPCTRQQATSLSPCSPHEVKLQVYLLLQLVHSRHQVKLDLGL